jgi:pimeloyl-ACP methyl ester carboxylesterase
MKKRYLILVFVILLAIVSYLIGPVPPDPDYNYSLPKVPQSPAKIESQLDKNEAELSLREDNDARIIWRDSVPTVTPISIVYLHGFAGSYRDGYPLNVNVAKAVGANIYLARWAGHGFTPDKALRNFSPEAAWESAKEALAIGSEIGDQVYVMSTSTGGTLALYLAAHFPDKVQGLINISPNVKDDQPGAFLLNSPWGYELAHLVSFGQHRKIEHHSAIAYQYWDSVYPAEALINLEVMLQSMMTDSTFHQVTCPVLTMYYHENFLEEDEHVEVSVYEEMYQNFSTPDSLLRLVPLAEPKTHFIGSDIKSEDYETAQKMAIRFLDRMAN